MQIMASNLAVALSVAITQHEAYEKALGYTQPSAILQGWREVLAALQRGERVEVVDSL